MTMIDKFITPLFLVVAATVMAGTMFGQDARSSGTNDVISRYLAMRKAAWGGPEKMLTKNEQAALATVVQEAKSIDSTSFAYHYLSYIHSPFLTAAVAHLAVAKQLRPTHEGVLHASIQEAHFTGNNSNLRKALEKFHASQFSWSTEELAYHRHVLISLPANAILITNGDDDTHPLLMLQYMQGIRKDVQVIRADFLQQASFLKQTSIPEKGHKKFMAASRGDAVAAAFIAFPAERIHLALTLPPSWLQRQSEGIINGLALGRQSAGHTLAQLVNRTADISPASINPSKEGAHRFDRNYLPLFLILEEYHKNTASGLAKGYTDAIERIKPKLKNPNVINNLPR